MRTALESLDHVIDECYQTSDTANLAPTLGYLVILLDRIDRYNQAATLCGATTRHRAAMAMVAALGEETERLRTILGPDVYAQCEAEGATMDTRQAVEFAHTEIRAALEDLADMERSSVIGMGISGYRELHLGCIVDPEASAWGPASVTSGHSAPSAHGCRPYHVLSYLAHGESDLGSTR